MKLKTIRADWLERDGRRLDCNPYMTGAMEARETLQALKARKEPLNSLTRGHNGGIYNGPQFRRNFVESREHGVPFLTSGSMLDADLSTLPLLRKRDAESAKLAYLRLASGTTLISCSGTIGRMVFVRPDMEQTWSSQDVLKVVPDESKIPPGYLYAFLSSKFGVPLVVGGTYGAIIQHIEAEHIAGLPVPRFGIKFETECDRLVWQASSARCDATNRLDKAQHLLMMWLDLTEIRPPWGRERPAVSQVVHRSEIAHTLRLEGYYYNATARHIDSIIRGRAGYLQLGDIADVYDVPPFKHIYVEADYGTPFFTSGELFNLDRRATKFLSKTRTKNLDAYILKRGWVLLARSGQLGGILGRPQYSDSGLERCATSDHVIRIVPKAPSMPSGYLYAFLASREIGYPLITRTMTGHSVPALWPSQLLSIPVLPLAKDQMKEIHKLVEEAFELRVAATAYEDEARSRVERAISEDQ